MFIKAMRAVAAAVALSGAVGTAAAQASVEGPVGSPLPPCAFTFQQGPPIVASEGISNVTNHQGTFAVSVNPHCSATSYYVELAIAGQGFAPMTGPVGLGGGSQAIGSATWTGSLLEDTTYEYRIHAWNAQGTVNGPVGTFHTAGRPIITNAQGSWGADQASFQATLNPEHSSAQTDPSGEVSAFEIEYYLEEGCLSRDQSCAPEIRTLPMSEMPFPSPQEFNLTPHSRVYEGTNPAVISTGNIANDLMPYGWYEFRLHACNVWGCTNSGWVFVEPLP